MLLRFHSFFLSHHNLPWFLTLLHLARRAWLQEELKFNSFMQNAIFLSFQACQQLDGECSPQETWATVRVSVSAIVDRTSVQQMTAQLRLHSLCDWEKSWQKTGSVHSTMLPNKSEREKNNKPPVLHKLGQEYCLTPTVYKEECTGWQLWDHIKSFERKACI